MRLASWLCALRWVVHCGREPEIESSFLQADAYDGLLKSNIKLHFMSPSKPPLFRKVNTTAHGVHHARGGTFRDERNTKVQERSERLRQSMHSHRERGLDYTPLFKFLLSKVGQTWNDVYSEAVKRLDRPEPIFWLVALQEIERHRYVRVGESSYYSGMYVDAEGRLQIVDPSMGPSSLVPQCKCCTHTFNGIPFTRPFAGLRGTVEPGGDGA